MTARRYSRKEKATFFFQILPSHKTEEKKIRCSRTKILSTPRRVSW